MPTTLFIDPEGLNIPKKAKAGNQVSDSHTRMTCRTFSAMNGYRLQLARNGVHRLLNRISEGKIVSQIILMLLVSSIPVTAQNETSLTIQGTMPSVQRLNISTVQTATAKDQNEIIVALDARNNAGSGYAVTIQSNISSARQNGDKVASQLKCDSHSLTLVTGAATLISKGTGGKSVKSVLKISNPPRLSDQTFTLTVISQ
jgi:hypothetical protein